MPFPFFGPRFFQFRGLFYFPAIDAFIRSGPAAKSTFPRTPTMADTQGLFSAISEKLPKHWSLILTLIFTLGTIGSNWASNHTHTADQIASQGERIATLEKIVRDDLATRHELDLVQSTLERVESKVDDLRKR
jgi:hypothetical protein